VSSKEGTFSKEGGHKSQKKFAVSFGLNYFSVVGGRTVQIRTNVWIWHENRGNLGTIFEVDFIFMFVVFGLYGTVHTIDCWQEKRGMEEVVQQYGFGTKNEAKFGGTVLVL
jgi:hypothetical protein